MTTAGLSGVTAAWVAGYTATSQLGQRERRHANRRRGGGAAERRRFRPVRRPSRAARRRPRDGASPPVRQPPGPPLVLRGVEDSVRAVEFVWELIVFAHLLGMAA